MVMEKEVADSIDSPLEGIFSSSASLYSNLLPREQSSQQPGAHKIGMVLSGGGARGALEVGAMKVILKKIMPDLIIGTSIGSINGAFVASGGTADELEEIWLHVSRRLLFPRNFSLFFKLFKAESMSKNINLKEILQRVMKKEYLEDCAIPLYINATRLSDGDSIFFNKGNIIDAVMASCAIPPLYPPYSIDGIHYLDGGVSTSNGVKKAVDLGCDTIIVLDSSNTKRMFNFEGIFDVTRHAFHIMFRKSLLNEIARCHDRRIILISCQNVDVAVNDFSRTAELIRLGEKAASEILDDFEF